MSALALVHVVFIAFWAGVVAVEFVLEAAARRRVIAHLEVALLHRWIDRVVELPVLIIVVTTGLALWSRSGFSNALLPKVALGLGAVTANLVCVVLVERRVSASEPGRRFRGIASTAFVGLPLATGALYLGGNAAQWW